MAKKTGGGKGGIEEMLQEVRAVLSRYKHLPEQDVLEALCEEADGWDMRFQELVAEERGRS